MAPADFRVAAAPVVVGVVARLGATGDVIPVGVGVNDLRVDEEETGNTAE